MVLVLANGVFVIAEVALVVAREVRPVATAADGEFDYEGHPGAGPQPSQTPSPSVQETTRHTNNRAIARWCASKHDRLFQWRGWFTDTTVFTAGG